MTRALILYTDGAARGNPGPAAIGIVLKDPQGNEIEALGETIGETTNNVAEYHALLRGLQVAAAFQAQQIEIRLDSELLVKQLNGWYRIRAENLKPLYEQVQRARQQFKSVTITHVPREQNRRADGLANQALNEKSDIRPPTIRRASVLPLLIIITGAPGSGKTTLGRQIAQRFHLPIIAKDDIKESLFDSLGWKDRAWLIQLGRATYDLIYYFVQAQLAAGGSLIVESNFDSESASAKFSELKNQHDFLPLQIVLNAKSDVLIDRFKTRARTQARHPGHVDQLSTDAEITATCQRRYASLDIGGKIFEIDTTDFGRVDYANVFAAIQAELSYSRHAD